MEQHEDYKKEVSWNTSLIRLVEEGLKSGAPAEYKRIIKLDNNGKLEYIAKNKGSLYFQYDKKNLPTLNAVLHPLFEKVITEEINKELCESYIPKSNRAMHNIIEFRIILQKYANNISTRSLEEESRLSLPYYLNIVESKFIADVNLIAYLLIKNNVKYYKYKKAGKKVEISDWKDIVNEKLSKNLKFLKDNGFSVISDACDIDLRNRIAHMAYIVFKNGSVAYENKSGVTIISKNCLDSKIEQLLNVCQCVTESIKQFYEQKYGFTSD